MVFVMIEGGCVLKNYTEVKTLWNNWKGVTCIFIYILMAIPAAWGYNYYYTNYITIDKEDNNCLWTNFFINSARSLVNL